MCLEFDTLYRFANSHSSTPHNPCGSGLARESGVSVAEKLPDTKPSRASPLPHWTYREHRFAADRNPLCCIQDLAGMPYLRRRMAMALWEVCRRAASKRLDG
ncbi:hypothetical protein EAH78_20200 [Pseudomonas arsenicoxydans]|uniref:Uncharacterized protein n=1 Tax=Pseudomonas arsenicoxydans TaxID=702115 RepID=A0A502HR48_9PSED|nr:hypothetical protein EAH78_20200 [Pseudomonas arsenicoxydans]